MTALAEPLGGLRVKLHSRLPGLVQRTRLVDPLAEKLVQLVLHLDGRVDRPVAAAAVGADGDQVLVVAVGGQQLADARGRLAVLLGGDVGHEPAEAAEHVDRPDSGRGRPGSARARCGRPAGRAPRRRSARWGRRLRPAR